MKKFFRTVSILLAAVMFMLLAACAPAKEEGLSLYLAFDEEDGNYAVDCSGNYEDARIEYYLTTAIYKQPESPRRRRGGVPRTVCVTPPGRAGSPSRPGPGPPPAGAETPGPLPGPPR